MKTIRVCIALQVMLFSLAANAQFTYKIKADSVKITNDSCAAELILENSTKSINGFLYNKGNGRTSFKKALEKINDTAYSIGGDTLRFRSGTLGGSFINNQYTAAQPDSRFWVSLPSRLDSSLTVMGKMMVGTTSIDSGYKMKITGGDVMINTITVGNGRSSIVSNTVLGRTALRDNTTGTHNVGIGMDALLKNTTGYDNIAIGSNSMIENTTGRDNTAVGYFSLHNNTSGNCNTGLGRGALGANITGSFNTGVGHHALYYNTTGVDNTSVGYVSLQNNTTGVRNTGIGAGTLANNTTGANNSATGASALQLNTTGSNNTVAGSNALRLNTTGNNNSVFGSYASYYNTIGVSNAAIGPYALYSNDSGSYNIAVGLNAAYHSVAADNNIAIGTNALYTNVAGINNVALGHYAGNTLDGGNNNILIGANIQPNVSVSASNQLNIGNWIYGDNGKIGLGVAIPTARLQVAAGNSSTPPVLLTQGTNTSTPVNGAVEYNGSNYFATTGSVRYTLAKTLTATASLDFNSTAASSSSELTMTLTGAADGDAVSLGIPGAAVMPNSSFTAWVSAANTITIRFCNNDAANPQNPASGTFRISLIKY